MLTLTESNLDVTAIIAAFVTDNEADPYYLSGSIAELGSNAASSTWTRSKRVATNFPITPETAEAIRTYLLEYGAWSTDELAEWSPLECIAMIVQECATTCNHITTWCDLNDVAYDDLYAAIYAHQTDAQAQAESCNTFFLADNKTADFYLGV